MRDHEGEGLRLAVVGSREFSNKSLMEAELQKFMPVAEVISGGARGADRMAENWARRNNIEPRVFYPEFKKYRHPYHHRNRLIAEACDHLVAFWNGHSTGTKYTIEYARRIGRPVTIVKF